MKDYYLILGIPRFTQSKELIKKAYREQILFFHPDNGNVSQEIAEEKTRDLNIGFNILMDDVRKYDYDKQLADYISANGQTKYDRVKKGYEYFRQSCPKDDYRAFYTASSQSSKTAENKNGSQTKEFNFKKIALVGLFILIVGVIYANSRSNSYSAENQTQASTNNINQSQQVTEPKVTEPQTTVAKTKYTAEYVFNGQVFKQPSGDCPCSLTVKTRSGSNYYVYLKAVSPMNKTKDLSFYVQGGQTVTKDVPLGTYEFYYCTGSTWYGTEHLFGDDTSASKSSDLFVFSSSISGDYIYYDTWEVTLYTVTNGNMSTDHISVNEFPS